MTNLKRGDGQSVAIADLDHYALVPILNDVTASEVSPGGRFAVASRLDRATGDVVSGILLLRSPGVFRAFSLPPGLSLSQVHWRRSITTKEPLARVVLPESTASTPIDVSYRLALSGRSKSGQQVDMPAAVLKYRTLDPGIADVDSDGVVLPQHVGQARIEVDAGGWITDTVRVDITAPRALLVLEESWDSTYLVRWRFFGLPFPKVVTAPDGTPAFWNRGDGSYSSGAYSDFRRAEANAGDVTKITK